jgi:hypothetical protein
MPAVSFITNTEYKATLEQDVGGLMFPGHLYDCGYNVDKTKLRKDFKELAGKRIVKVLIYTEESPKFSKEQNTLIKYQTPSVANENQEGAFQRTCGHPAVANMWWSNHPMGDAIVVYTETKPKVKEEKVEGVPSASELKTLRKEWREHKDRYEHLGSRPRSYSGEYTQEDLDRIKVKGQAHDEKTKLVMDKILKIAEVLLEHDTPTTKKQLSKWIYCRAYVTWRDSKWQTSTGKLYEFA